MIGERLPQSRYSRAFLSPISNMNFETYGQLKYATFKVCFFHVFTGIFLNTLQAHPQVFGCECKSISILRNVLLYLFCGDYTQNLVQKGLKSSREYKARCNLVIQLTHEKGVIFAVTSVGSTDVVALLNFR